MKFFKCVLWAIKEYESVGIAIALFLLLGFQIEKQYRSTRYFENCISQDWTFYPEIYSQGYDLKTKKVTDKKDLENIVYKCNEIRKDSVLSFNYFKGKTHIYITDYANFK